MERESKWGRAKREHQERAKRRKTVEYEVTLPRSLPIPFRGNEGLHERYKLATKTGRTMALSEREAINNVFYKTLGALARVAYSELRENGRSLDAEARLINAPAEASEDSGDGEMKEVQEEESKSLEYEQQALFDVTPRYYHDSRHGNWMMH